MAVSSTSSSTSALSSFRLTGLATGLDTDTLVKQLMSIEKAPLNKLYQKKQLAEWKQDDYRSITNLLRGLKDEFFNVAKSSSNMLSASSFKKYTGTSTNSSIVTVSGNSAATSGTHTVSVYKLATAGKAESGSGVTDDLEGNAVSNYSLSGKKLQITLDGVTREITLDDYSFTAGTPATSDIVSKASTGLQALVDNAFGSGKITVSYDGDTQKIKFDSAGGASKVTIAGGDAISELGFTSGASNRLDVSQSLESLASKFAADLTFNAEGKLSFTINSTEFTFDKSTSLSSMMNTINSSASANVNMKYDETTDKFIITSKQLGYGENIVIDTTQGGSFFGAGGASGINTGNATTTQGDDAQVEIDGQMLTRSSNSFSVNGVTYNLISAHTTPATQKETVSLSLDTDSVFNNIKSFVDKYNEVIDTINTKLTEKYDRDYQPLTDDQKSEMEADDITKWEEKAKTGLLRNDPILEKIVTSMRQALSQSVSGVEGGLASIGITTGSWQDKGKLVIDEEKLKSAISSDPEKVAQLFTKTSDVSYAGATTAELRAQRYSEEGLANRISDILDDNIRTVGGKGTLLQKAGLKGDRTEYDSVLYDEITGYNTRIAAMIDQLNDKEDRYYAKFTALETAISKMNSQSSWLASQLGTSSN